MSENPYDATSYGDAAPARRTGLKSCFAALAVVGAAMLLIALLLPPAVRSARPAARRNSCPNNLKQIALALQNYQATYHAFPPAYTVDAEGKRLHSWRTLILPFLEGNSLYKKIDLSRAWDDPVNVAAIADARPPYWCPAAVCPANCTTYLAVIAPGSCFRPAEPRTMSEIEDAHKTTLMVIEVTSDRAVPWMSPNDTDEQFVLNFGASSKLDHAAGTHGVFADGSVRFLDVELPAADRRAMISITGHESIDLDSYDGS